MADPFLGEIRTFSFNFPPKGWADCNGQFLPINQNQALFALLGTTYGGNGQTTFALPDLRGRVPVHVAGGWPLGTRRGTEAVTLSASQLPAHTHALRATSAQGTAAVPAVGSVGQVFAGERSQPYGPATNLVATAPSTVAQVGGGQPHENRQPFLALRCCIALQGIFPSQN